MYTGSARQTRHPHVVTFSESNLGKMVGSVVVPPLLSEGAVRLDADTQYTHVLCIMATKTISLRVEAYEKLRRARTRPNESFSDVVMRARWDDQTVTGGELLVLLRERGPLYDSEELDVIEELKSEGRAPADKWPTP